MVLLILTTPGNSDAVARIARYVSNVTAESIQEYTLHLHTHTPYILTKWFRQHDIFVVNTLLELHIIVSYCITHALTSN